MDVSVVTPFYEEPLNLLERNVYSVATQKTKYKFEHLVVIDNPNVSIEIIKYLHANQVPYKIHFQNAGLSASRNSALERASGKYIMILDTDDSFVEGRIETQINYMEENNYDHTYGGFQPIHGNSNTPEKEKVIPPEFSLDYLLDFNNICYCGSNCFKREVYEKIGGFDVNMKDGAEDLEYWIRIATNGYRVGLLPEVLYYLGITSHNMTAQYLAEGRFSKAYEYIRRKYPHLKFTT